MGSKRLIKPFLSIIFSIIYLHFTGYSQEFDTVDITRIDISDMKQDFGIPCKNCSVTGNKISIAGKTYSKGLGTHSGSKLTLEINKNAHRFHALVGIDDYIFPDIGSAEFLVLGNGKVLWRSGIMKRGMPAKECNILLDSMQFCELLVFNGDDNIYSDHANWADAYFIMNKNTIPKPYKRIIDSAIILTPSEPLSPRIHSVHSYGAKPNKQILYYIPVGGVKPIDILVSSLPKGLTYNPISQIISGQLSIPGIYPLLITATNQYGNQTKKLDIIIGDTISYTPILGWSSWYTYWEYITQKEIVSQALALKKTGLADYGFNYIMVDDGWQDTSIQQSKAGLKASSRFPDLKGLGDTLHALGYKYGLYSSPGPLTCVQLPGSYGHELQDAELFCSVGADLVKYDWCYYQQIYDSLMKQNNASIIKESKRPFELLSNYLQQCSSRDIFFNICQYGNNDVWKWARSAGGNSWRTTTDIQDNWWSVSNTIGFTQQGLQAYAGFNGWNDMDFLRIGNSLPGIHKRPTQLTPQEQYSHVSLWALLNSPLILSCYVDELDSFSLNLLKNEEVLSINQDKLGKQGDRIFKDIWQEVWAKKLDSNALAIGMFNRDDIIHQTITVNWEQLQISDPNKRFIIRDLWRGKNIGTFSGSFSAQVPDHGVLLFKMIPESPVNTGNTIIDEIASINISPIPASDIIHISVKNPVSGKISIEMYSITGAFVKEIYHGFADSGEMSIVNDSISLLANGIYIVRLHNPISSASCLLKVVH